MSESREKTPVLLMVSGGSDSMALLELVCAYLRGGAAAEDDELLQALVHVLPAAQDMNVDVLHVNHMLRGTDADTDERFVRRRCAELGIACEAQRVDIAALAAASKGGVEVVARERRYALAEAALERLGGKAPGIICTAHTLDDRIETFYMRSLVGTGPGGLASIPRRRGNICRPLLDATREQLREWLRLHHPGMPDEQLWREDASNLDGTNFRSQVRMQLIPVLRQLRPGFENPLAQTMDLIAEQDDALEQEAQSIVYRNVAWNGEVASIPANALCELNISMAKRVLKNCLLVVNPDARLESAQIARIYEHLRDAGYVTEVSGGIRVQICDGHLVMRREQ